MYAVYQIRWYSTAFPPASRGSGQPVLIACFWLRRGCEEVGKHDMEACVILLLCLSGLVIGFGSRLQGLYVGAERVWELCYSTLLPYLQN